ncbi:hypothetical protein H7A76_09080 [Pseudomonas sp. MSSRFD41]|uniref:hypothetical protein n=1 Tax=Pseudomonas sp. MSSRFD41 TaxID=1310370 RepID=UPI00163A9F26|nr:hypothetical protein [Pseudomonas sp. MSSRFD41]MBC2655587.1 hypothetical protein [Pseudomonas sp. MSSRFD41]
MSVLNFPRIYFNGHMYWNPPTANNNDVFPLYDAVNMCMNWKFLNTFGINDANASSQLLPWMITGLKYEDVPDYVLQVPGNGSPKGYPMIPAEWDLFGDNSCGTVDYKNIRSTVVGGELQASNYISNDALINKGYQFYGAPFGGTEPTPARFVDISPWQNTFTALYFDNMTIGDDQCGLVMPRQYRMLDRFLNFNWGAFGGLNYVTTTWQTCFPKETLQWNVGHSVLLQTLFEQMNKQGAQGLMFRFTTFLTFYDLNGIFNDFPPVNSHSKSEAALQAMHDMYQKGLNNVADIFYNPAYSRTVGTLGLWFADKEYPTAPAGLRLAPKEPVPFFKAVPGDSIIYPPTRDQTVTLGVISAQANGDVLSLDLGNTFPFFPVGDDPLVPPAIVEANKGVPVPGKFNVGSYDVVYRTTDSPTPITLASFGFEHYRQSEYDKRAGLLDLPLSPQAQEQLKQEGRLELHLQGSSPTLVAAAQQTWTAEVIESGSFINVGDPQPLTLKIMVQCNGKPAPKGTRLRVTEYNNAFSATTSNYYLGFTNDEVDFTLINDYPEDRSQNTENLPRFVNSQVTANFLAVGSGRRLQALSKAEKQASVPITYKAFLGKPSAVSLKACLQLVGGQPQQTPLDGSNINVNYSVALIETDDQGVAQISVKGIAPGFPTLRFFLADEPVSFSFNVNDAYTDFLAPIRVLPEEPNLLEEFVETWNQVYKYTDSNVRIWNQFIFPRILRPFYYLYPIMNKFMPLDSLQRIEGAIDQFTRLISQKYQEESTLAMPITRDLPQSRRRVLETWANQLVKQGYPPQELNLTECP